jgi:hypothetical protein
VVCGVVKQFGWQIHILDTFLGCPTSVYLDTMNSLLEETRLLYEEIDRTR